jgi:small subunit ribosomal protein S5
MEKEIPSLNRGNDVPVDQNLEADFLKDPPAPEEAVAEDVSAIAAEKPTDSKAANLKENVIYINRVTKVVSGGKRLAFSAIVVVGDGSGSVGIGRGKARDVPLAIAKASYQAKKHLIKIPLHEKTVPFSVVGVYGAGRVLLRPACSGTGVIAGGAIRAILEACGVRDILTKNLGSSNIHSVIHAVLDALKQLRTKEDIAKKRGKKVEEL